MILPPARSLLLVILLLTPGMAGAQDTLAEIASGVGIPIRGDEGFGELLRAPDDSDTGMQVLVREFFALTPCGTQVNGLCPEALGLLTGGGDRLATYLINQWERSAAEGFPDRYTYLLLLGHTESPRAYRYLDALVDLRWEQVKAGVNPDAVLHYADAIDALGRTRQPQVAERVLKILETSQNRQVRVAAVNALDRVQARQGEVPGSRERLKRVLDNIPENTKGGHHDNVDRRRIEAVLANPGRTRP